MIQLTRAQIRKPDEERQLFGRATYMLCAQVSACVSVFARARAYTFCGERYKCVLRRLREQLRACLLASSTPPALAKIPDQMFGAS